MDLKLIEQIKREARKQFSDEVEKNGDLNIGCEFFDILELPHGLWISGIIIEDGLLFFYAGDKDSFSKVNARAFTNWTGRQVLAFTESYGRKCVEPKSVKRLETITFKHAVPMKGIGLIKQVVAYVSEIESECEILAVRTLDKREVDFDRLTMAQQMVLRIELLYACLVTRDATFD